MFFELLLLKENEETLFAHKIAIAHSIKLKVDEEGDPFDNEGCSVVSICPFVESFILNNLSLIHKFAFVMNLLSCNKIL